MAKISGIGCSSKTPTTSSESHGFNSVHGRMPSVLTGANLANRDLIYLGVSGDGDSASIGFGQFAHSIRRGVNMVYIVENNGVYGLTKGQFSATADRGSKIEARHTNNDNAIDLVAIAMQLGATFVARCSPATRTQLVPIIKAAIEHQGAAFIDVLSPCVAFNNHLGSTKSFDFVRMHNEAVNRLDFISGRAPITVNYEPGTVEIVEQHDGSRLALQESSMPTTTSTIGSPRWLPVESRRARARWSPGCSTSTTIRTTCTPHLEPVDAPLNALGEKELCPGSAALEKFNAELALRALSATASRRLPS